MNVLLTLISFLIFLGYSFLPAQVHAAVNTYYVTQNGNGARSGNSLSNAWSVSDFNNSANWSANDNAGKIDPGDTVYFSGTIRSHIIIPGSGSSNGNITLDGYEAGNCDPINSECTSSAVVDGTGTFGIAATSPRSYITVQDFRVKNVNEGIYFSGKSNHILVRRNYVYKASAHGLKFPGDEGSSGDINYVIVGGSPGNGNLIVNAGQSDGQGQMMNYRVKHLLISYNKFTNDDGSYGREGVINHESSIVLVEKNDISHTQRASEEPALATKTDGGNASDIIFRFNNIHDTIGNGITVINKASNIYIYGNMISNTGTAGIAVALQQWDIDHVNVWSNIIVGSKRIGIDLANYYPGGNVSDINIFNNTISGNGTSTESYTDSGLRHETGDNVQVANNIFKDNLTQGGRNQEIWSGDSGVTLRNNQYYCSSGSPVLTGISQESDSYDGNPKFSGSGSYTLQSDSPAIDAGTSKSGCFSVNLSNGDSWFETYSGYSTVTVCYDEALDPNGTNWDTVPPTVRAAKQGSYGAWERGAYVYTGTSSSAIASPVGLKIMLSN